MTASGVGVYVHVELETHQMVIPHAVLRWALRSTRAAPEAMTPRAPSQEIGLRRSPAFGDHRGRCRKVALVRAARRPTRTERRGAHRAPRSPDRPARSSRRRYGARRRAPRAHRFLEPALRRSTRAARIRPCTPAGW